MEVHRRRQDRRRALRPRAVVIAAEQYACRLVVPQSQQDAADAVVLAQGPGGQGAEEARRPAPPGVAAPARGRGQARQGGARARRRAGPDGRAAGQPPGRGRRSGRQCRRPRGPARLTPRPRSTTSSTPSSRRARRPSSRPSDCGPGGRSGRPALAYRSLMDSRPCIAACIPRGGGKKPRPTRTARAGRGERAGQ